MPSSAKCFMQGTKVQKRPGQVRSGVGAIAASE